jgi:hypothetical protein
MVTAISFSVLALVLGGDCSKEHSLLPVVEFAEPYTVWGASGEEVVAVNGQPEIIADLKPGRSTYGYTHKSGPVAVSSYIVDDTEGLVMAALGLKLRWQQVEDFLATRYTVYSITPSFYRKYFGNAPEPSLSGTIIGLRPVGNIVLAVYGRAKEFASEFAKELVSELVLELVSEFVSEFVSELADR